MTRRASVGRNDRCACGSGHKYKRCCLRRGETISAELGINTALTFKRGELQRMPTDKLQAGVVPVVLVRDGKVVDFLGTAFSITVDGLFVTADHVITDIPGFEYPEDVTNEWVGVIWLDHAFTGDGLPGMPSIVIPFEYVYRNPGHDVAAARTLPMPKDDGTLVTYVPLRLDFAPPRQESVVLGLGYPDVDIHPDVPLRGGKIHDATADLYGASGEVLQVNQEGMGAYKPYPHAWTNANFAKGMSGGPVISSESGRVCGIIHAGLPEPAYRQERTSAFCLSGVALDLVVNQPTPDDPPETLLDLIQDGVVYGGPECERIEVRVDDSGDKRILMRNEPTATSGD
jgi:hypothetical protein